MHRSPEALVAGLRKRKSRIVTFSILTIACGGLLAMSLYVAARGYSLLVPKEGDDLAFHVTMAVPIVPAIAFCQTMAVVYAMGLGLAAAMLIGELTSFTKNDLLVELWDRVQSLEKARSTSASQGPPQGQSHAD